MRKSSTNNNMPNMRDYGKIKHTPFTIDLSFFRPSKCNIKGIHDFPDTPCKKCNFSLKNEIGNWACVVIIGLMLAIAIYATLI